MQDRTEAHEIDGGLGHGAMTIAIQNRSSSRCILQGIPTLKFLGKSESPFSVSVCSNCADYLFSGQPVDEIRLEPKAIAYVVLGYDINDGAHGEIACRTAVAFSLRLQAWNEHLRFRPQDRDGMRSCGPVNITPFLAKPPVDGDLPHR